MLDVEESSDDKISTFADNILLLKYIEIDGELKRAVAVIKARGSDHEKHLYEVYIDSTGLHITGAFEGVEGLLSGRTKRVVMPPLDVTDLMKEIDQLRHKYVDGKIPFADYEKEMHKLRERLEKIQRRGF